MQEADDRLRLAEQSAHELMKEALMAKNHRPRGHIKPIEGKKNVWQVRVVTGYDASGKHQRVSKVIHGTKRDAENYMHEILAQIARGTYSEPSKMTLDDLFDLWLRHREGTIRASTLKAYEDKLRLYARPTLGNCRLDKLNAAQVMDLYAMLRQRLSPRSIKYLHTTLNAALEHGVVLGFIPRNPLERIPVSPGVRYAGRSFTEEQAGKFMRLAIQGDRWDQSLAFGLATAMRPSEYLALRWKDLDLDKGTATIEQTVTRRGEGWKFDKPKTKESRRTIDLPQSLLPSLRKRKREYLQEKLAAGKGWHDLDLVFSTSTGTPGNLGNLTKRHFKPLLKAAGIAETFRLYDLRHSSASLMLLRGINVKVVSERLGHKNIAITLSTYAHVLPSMQHEAVAKLDDLLFGS